MKRRNRYPVAEWPWYLRWTAGTVLFLCVVLPLCLVIAAWEAVRDGFSAFQQSSAWGCIIVSVAGIALGTDKT